MNSILGKQITILVCVIVAGLIIWKLSPEFEHAVAASRFAKSVGAQVAMRYDGERDLQTDLNSWAYDAAAREFKLDVTIRWSGSFKSTNKYWVKGQLKVSEDGDHWTFLRSDLSPSLALYAFGRKILDEAILGNSNPLLPAKPEILQQFASASQARSVQSPPAEAVDNSPRQQLYVVRGIPVDSTGHPGFLNVREGPGVTFAVKTKLRNGDNHIRILETAMNGRTEWAHVMFAIAEGWVVKTFLNLE